MTRPLIVPELAEHTPLQPLWICRVDAHPWPCADAKLSLIGAFLPFHQIELYLYLAIQFTTAVAELDAIVVEAGGDGDPYSLHASMIGWLIEHETRIRRRRHTI
ncbi:hypothetical protein [Micromonospora sp. NPDC004704]